MGGEVSYARLPQPINRLRNDGKEDKKSITSKVMLFRFINRFNFIFNYKIDLISSSIINLGLISSSIINRFNFIFNYKLGLTSSSIN